MSLEARVVGISEAMTPRTPRIVSTVPRLVSPSQFFTIPVQCSGVAGSNQASAPHPNTVFTMVTADMTVQDLVSIVLARCDLKGFEPSAFCIVAESVLDKTTGSKDDSITNTFLETCVLDDTASPLESDACVTGLKSTTRLSIRQRRGKVVEVYDGRKWPVVRCGSVYVTAEDTAQKVTQTVVTATSVAEKKRRASKYTVAIGTSHGHVQAFLEDADSVLAALDQCQAEEKCLMLIKRPKDAAKKMLKSHSWANLSVSDPQLYRQFNGLQLSQLQTAQHQLQKVKRSSDQQSVASNDTDRSETRRRYISARKEGARLGHRSLPDGTRQSVTSPDSSFYSDTSSTASDYQYVGRRNREHSRRGERYPSIPEDGQEINNNSNKGRSGDVRGSNDMYNSCQDISYTSPPDSGRGRRQGHHGEGRIASDQMYHQNQRGPDAPTHDPGDLAEDGVRSQSLGNLSTGLTLSLVGQRKADSMLDLSSTGQPPPRARGPRHRASDGAPYPEHVRSPKDTYPDSARRSRDSYPDSVRSPRDSNYQDSARSSRDSGSDNVFSPRDSRGFVYPDAQSPPYTSRHSGNYYNPSSGGGKPGTENSQRGHPNGYAYSNASSSREQTPQSDVPPPKPKRSLPQVPPVETSERIKRFTEMMRSRMSVSSSNGRSTANSQASTTPQTPLSRQASVTDNGSDFEVSTLLEVRRKSSGNSPEKLSDSAGRRPPDHANADTAWKEGVKDSRGGKYSHPHPQHHMHPPPRHRNVHETPQSYGDHSSDSGQTPFTSHSHSSTMDSGYTTNTEGDADSTVMSHNASHFSPPHHLHHPPQPHPHHHNAPDSRPAPPRNLTLATARKFSSMQNVSTVHQNGYGHHNCPPNQHPDTHNGDVNGNRPPPHYKGPGPVRAQHPSHDHLSTEQRRSWDLAQSFKSLDFQPVPERDQNAGRRQSQEEALLKPQAVAVNGSAKHFKTSTPRRADPHQNGFDNRRSLPNGYGGVNWQDNQHVNNESNGMNTLPGHWKYNGPNKDSGNHSNNNSHNNKQNGNKVGGAVIGGTPITAPPTLFQITQTFDLCSVRLSLPADVSVKDVLTLTSVQVSLPAPGPGTPTSPGPLQSPQGRMAQLGGPGSAFRPVRANSGTQQVTVGVTGVGHVGEQCKQLCTCGEIHAGDVLVELNGWYCLNSDHLSVQRVLENCQGEVTLTIARTKDESLAARVKQLEQTVKTVESEVQRLTQEVAKKDARILELSTMLPWKADEETNGDKLVLESEEGAFVIGDNEFVV